MRYFIDYVKEKPSILYRFNSDEDSPTLIEEVWKGKKWVTTNVVSKGLVYGNAEFDEVKQDAAKKAFPEAF
jgi:hypothetical protein